MAWLDRPTDRADFAAAVLDPAARAWLADTLDRLGHIVWTGLVRDTAWQTPSMDQRGADDCVPASENHVLRAMTNFDS